MIKADEDTKNDAPARRDQSLGSSFPQSTWMQKMHFTVGNMEDISWAAKFLLDGLRVVSAHTSQMIASACAAPWAQGLKTSITCTVSTALCSLCWAFFPNSEHHVHGWFCTEISLVWVSMIFPCWCVAFSYVTYQIPLTLMQNILGERADVSL